MLYKQSTCNLCIDVLLSKDSDHTDHMARQIKRALDETDPHDSSELTTRLLQIETDTLEKNKRHEHCLLINISH